MKTIGTCSLCAGPVMKTEGWGNSIPQRIQCVQCGAVAVNGYGPTIEMVKPDQEFPLATAGGCLPKTQGSLQLPKTDPKTRGANSRRVRNGGASAAAHTANSASSVTAPKTVDRTASPDLSPGQTVPLKASGAFDAVSVNAPSRTHGERNVVLPAHMKD